MGIFLGYERRAAHAFPEPPIPPYLGASTSGGAPSVATNPNVALTVPTVWACVGLLANAVSMLELETYRRTADVPARAPDPPLLVSPAEGMTQSEWLHMLMVSLLLRGNAYGLVVGRDNMQRPTQIELLNPDRVQVDIDRDTGKVTYKSGTRPYPTADVWHVRGLTMPGSKVGLSPIAYAAATLGIDLNSREFAEQFFAGGGIPKAVLMNDRPVDEDQARTIKARLMEVLGRSREPLILGAGFKYEQVQVKPEESQFLATQQANVAQIARYFWVPPEMVGGSSGSSMTYANVEQRSLDFLTYGVSFWLKRIEDAMFPLFSRPTYVRFNPKNLLRTDAETQAKVDVQLIAGKIKVPSEVRESRDLPPMTDAQKAEADMVPLTITPLGGAKALPALKTLPGPTAPVPADDTQGAVNG